MESSPTRYCLEESGRVIGVAADGFERLLYDGKRRIRTSGVETGIVLMIRIDASDEFVVVRRIEHPPATSVMVKPGQDAYIRVLRLAPGQAAPTGCSR